MGMRFLSAGAVFLREFAQMSVPQMADFVQRDPYDSLNQNMGISIVAISGQSPHVWQHLLNAAARSAGMMWADSGKAIEPKE